MDAAVEIGVLGWEADIDPCVVGFDVGACAVPDVDLVAAGEGLDEVEVFAREILAGLEHDEGFAAEALNALHMVHGCANVAEVEESEAVASGEYVLGLVLVGEAVGLIAEEGELAAEVEAAVLLDVGKEVEGVDPAAVGALAWGDGEREFLILARHFGGGDGLEVEIEQMLGDAEAAGEDDGVGVVLEEDEEGVVARC